MNDELIQALWQQGKASEPKMSLKEIETVLARSARSGWSELRRMVWFYLAVMASGVLLSGWNYVTYRTNPGWLAALAGMVALLLAFIGYGAGVLREMRALDQPLDGLAIQVKRQMRFFRTRYQVWMGTVAAAIWLVCFGVSLQMYYEDGRYGVSIDGGLVAFSVMQAAIIYGLVRVAHHLLSQRLVAALEDLEAQATEQTERIARSQRWQTVLLILAVIAGAALFSALLLHFLSR
jgi:hypothetical protein